MPTLREVQQTVAQSLLARDDSAAANHIVDDQIPAVDRLRIYRNTFIGTLISALRLTFPVVERLVGQEFFEGSAAAFVERHPPCSAYLNEYGAPFGDFLAAFPPASSLPYLPDVARLEWAVSCATCAPDAPVLHPAAVPTLDEADQGKLRFIAHPSVRLVAVRYPADYIWGATRDRDDDALANIDLKLEPLWLLVHRCDGGVLVRRLTEEEGRFTAALCAGRPLAEAIPPETPANLVTMLAEHLAKGRFAGIETVRSEVPR